MYNLTFRKNNILILLIGIALATLGWYYAFGVEEGVFWYKLAFSIIVVSMYALIFMKVPFKITAKSFFEGLISAFLLYFIFFLGNIIAPYIVNESHSQVSLIYQMGGGSSKVFIFILLFFVTSPGEEIFWRAFLQGGFTEHIRAIPAFLLVSIIYACVHIFSGNLMLTLAAFVAGLYWGLQFLWRKDIVANIVSHAFFSAFIFAVFPIS
jgi:membrane protease YdiL (CAAX protease family)